MQFDLGLSTNFLSSKFGYYIRCIERITTARIRLHECAAWSAPLLFACNLVRFSCNMPRLLCVNVCIVINVYLIKKGNLENSVVFIHDMFVLLCQFTSS